MIRATGEQKRFVAWAAVTLIVVLPAWWLWGADAVAALLRPVVGLALSLTGLPGGVEAGDGWLVATGFSSRDSGAPFSLPLTQDVIRRLLLGFPLYFAFLLAPPRTDRPVSALIAGPVLLAGVFVVSATALVWGQLAPLLDPALAPAGTTPGPALTGAPLHPAAAQAALMGRYLGLSVLPLATAVVLWAILNSAGRRTMIGEIGARD